ncbi:MAG: site-2 protease family protein [Candidatus Nealsonbacteria bacterium CG02_land_8_20_14_3_00_37_10]|uniref:Site-2 protease family protein n=2 Tax=Candidatus Nealsoniibacteriota TaxID=1817911 RepID=A0A2G9YZ31_9BACT|nr:MAG: site-2 protease family protein [Candidatus Nealsonbacteria bacterium CG23_combo_of_CG06-09_8_20_14_all_37_18]PIV45283.1 MAG: site-2 protease family protein [Candidatus Nealsonbacteria bacterium CG02_land_8_20_14_3_00_37_10]
MDPTIIFFLIVLIFSIVIHEVAHGSVANLLGDPTAKYAGRLTLNPIKHLDLFGSVLVPLFLIILRSPVLFGWAKPVPINPYNFKDPKWDGAKVAVAGPGANILVALIFGLAIRFFPLPASILTIFSIIVILNLILAIFNLVPIPPLDGSHILFTFLPEKFANIKLFLHQFGIFILLFFMLFALRWIFLGVVWLYYLITGQPPELF